MRDRSLFEAKKDVYQAIFDRLILPVPDYEDCVASNKGGSIVLLEALGLVIKIEEVKVVQSLTEHPAILDPLYQEDIEGMRVRIFPAVEVSKSGLFNGDREEEMQAYLKQEGYNFWDNQHENVGYVQLGAFPWQKVKVILDHDAVAKSLKTAQKISNATKAKYAQVKKKFSPLKAAFDKAKETGDFTDAYKLCRMFTENKKLVCGWKKYRKSGPINIGFGSHIVMDDRKSKKAHHAAKSYASKLERSLNNKI
jgi:hypothetical protein